MMASTLAIELILAGPGPKANPTGCFKPEWAFRYWVAPNRNGPPATLCMLHGIHLVCLTRVVEGSTVKGPHCFTLMNWVIWFSVLWRSSGSTIGRLAKKPININAPRARSTVSSLPRVGAEVSNQMERENQCFMNGYCCGSVTSTGGVLVFFEL